MLSFKEHIFAAIGSTNTDLLKNHRFLDEGTVYQSLVQKSGKGRAGNKWVSKAGNLYISILLRPQIPLSMAALVSFVAAVSLSKTLEDYVAFDRIELKWPNDVLVDGRKISGILLESDFDVRTKSLSALIVGMGVNLNHKPDIDTAISLSEILGENNVDIDLFKHKLFQYFKQVYSSFLLEGFAPIRNVWLSKAYKLNQMITVRLNQDTIFDAIFENVSEDGCLIAKLPSGEIKKISSAELFF